MIEGSVPRPTAADWSGALLTSGTESLLGAVRNYIGPIKTPYDKRDLVGYLEAFLRRAETRDSLIALLDNLDIRILGSSLFLGSVPEQAIKDLFAGELPLFELGVRISNLLDRLLLFRYQIGGRRFIAVNPLLEEDLRVRVLDPRLFFSSGPENLIPGSRSFPEPSSVPGSSSVDAKTAVALFSFFFHAPFSTRKGGGLTKRAAERAAALLPDFAASGGVRLGALTRALAASGIMRAGDEDERSPDRDTFARLLAEWKEDLPFFLAASIAIDGSEMREEGVPEGSGGGAAVSLALVLASALSSLPRGLALSRPVLARWLRIVARRAHLAVDPAAAIAPLEELGILATNGAGLSLALPPSPAPRAPQSRQAGVLVAEGAHALHLMPEASLEDRLFVGCVARPVTIGTVWGFDVERETVRRAFAAGLTAAEIRSRFESLSGAALPQSFAFSLAAWEEEFRALRFYRGFTLVADERLRPVIERSGALGKILIERLAPGVYFLSATTPEEAIAALVAAGLEAPPLTLASGPRPASARKVDGDSLFPGGAPLERGEAAGTGIRARIDALNELVAADGFSRLGTSQDRASEGQTSWAVEGQTSFAGGQSPDPEPRLSALRAILAASDRPDDERREFADRIERRLVLTARQIAQADPKLERLEAGGLDYLGKVRVVERAIRSAGDRLEVLYRLPGAEPVRALLRPVRLDKTEKGLVLEAEDLVTGGPARVPLGSVSTVRRVRASLFGEDQ